ncbi:hypothetical protein GRI33_10825 [Brucella sp. BO3]|nr:hypothetical protein [Brucella sp. 09RB8918]MRN78056.1 hypothetical protein [Brucella sp. 10RB9210]QMV27478.1 hypothetical protein GRI33_10825 [Brucella sp. BO3]
MSGWRAFAIASAPVPRNLKRSEKTRANERHPVQRCESPGLYNLERIPKSVKRFSEKMRVKTKD